MAKDTARKGGRAPQAAEPAPASAAALAALVGLGALAALWALFLWAELLLARSGGTPFCPLGSGADCAAVWDSPFASTVHRITGVPVAGWGVVWGLVAFVLPLVALVRRAEGQPVAAWLSAVRITAAAGLLSVLVFLGVSLSARAFCGGCFVSYAIVAGYVGIALFGWQKLGLPEAPRAAALAASLTLGFYLALLYPGSRTPRNAEVAGREALPAKAVSGGTGDADRDRALKELVGSLEPDLRQILSDSLYLYRNSPRTDFPTPRALLGPVGAPVRITEWTDVLCDHCAELHKTLVSLRQHLPADSFSVESRQFPLDGACNPLLAPSPEPSVRCLAAKAEICLEADGHSFDYAGSLFENQKSLTPEKVYSLAKPYMDRKALGSCVKSMATEAKLNDDVELASRYDPDGTPIVAVNGRHGTSFGPFLYAMILTKGVPTHPAFDSLPTPNPRAHLH